VEMVKRDVDGALHARTLRVWPLTAATRAKLQAPHPAKSREILYSSHYM